MTTDPEWRLSWKWPDFCDSMNVDRRIPSSLSLLIWKKLATKAAWSLSRDFYFQTSFASNHKSLYMYLQWIIDQIFYWKGITSRISLVPSLRILFWTTIPPSRVRSCQTSWGNYYPTLPRPLRRETFEAISSTWSKEKSLTISLESHLPSIGNGWPMGAIDWSRPSSPLNPELRLKSLYRNTSIISEVITVAFGSQTRPIFNPSELFSLQTQVISVDEVWLTTLTEQVTI